MFTECPKVASDLRRCFAMPGYGAHQALRTAAERENVKDGSRFETVAVPGRKRRSGFPGSRPE